jgi:hypothetical protein
MTIRNNLPRTWDLRLVAVQPVILVFGLFSLEVAYMRDPLCVNDRVWANLYEGHGCVFSENSLPNVLAHPRRDGSLKNKLDACRRRMERLVRVKRVWGSEIGFLFIP